jgi:hypothetical protein
MQNKLIFLSGKSSCGKTIALKLLVVKLLNAGAQIDVCTRKSPTSVQSLTTEIQYEINNHLDAKDLIIVLIYRGVRIGIRTCGDTIGAVWDNVWFFEKKECDIGVSACHPEHLVRSKSCLIAPWHCHAIIDTEKETNSNLYFQADKTIADNIFNTIDIIVNIISNFTNIGHP